MDTKTILKMLIVRQGITQNTLAERLDQKVSTTNMQILSKNISVKTLLPMLEALNCRLVIMPDSTKVPKDAYEVTLE